LLDIADFRHADAFFMMLMLRAACDAGALPLRHEYAAYSAIAGAADIIVTC